MWNEGSSVVSKRVLCIMIMVFCSSVTFADNVIWKAYTSKPMVALTFDDGPTPEHTIPILNILDKFNAKASFFIIGKKALIYKDIVFRIHGAGHDIGNHTFSHPDLTTLSKEKVAAELEKTNAQIESITNTPVKFFRPPGGRLNTGVKKEIQKKMKIIMWDVNTGDYTPKNKLLSIIGEDSGLRSAKQIIDSTCSNVQNGSIILLHNGGQETIKALPVLIEKLQDMGFQFVTLSTLLGG